MYKNYEIRFNIDSSGIYIDQQEPIHLDSLLAWSYLSANKLLNNLEQEDIPIEPQLPLKSSIIEAKQVNHASALFPASENTETLRFWRKKFRMSKINLISGSINDQQGVYRSYNTPMPITLTPYLFGYFCGDKERVEKLLTELKSLGKKRLGKIISIEFIETPEDWSLVKDGLAMRWLPFEGGTRLVRTIPPYWHKLNRTDCCEVGDDYTL